MSIPRLACLIACASSDAFIKESPLVPDTVKELHAQSQEIDLREKLADMSGQTELPAQTLQELEYAKQRE